MINCNVEKFKTFIQSYVCAEILSQLVKLQGGYEVLPSLTLAIGGGLTPDFSIYTEPLPKPNFLRDIERFETMPLIAIEVLSSNQTFYTLSKQVEMLIEAGVKSVWLVDPRERKVFVVTKGETEIVYNTLVETNGITVDFAKIFESHN